MSQSHESFEPDKRTWDAKNKKIRNNQGLLWQTAWPFNKVKFFCTDFSDNRIVEINLVTIPKNFKVRKRKRCIKHYLGMTIICITGLGIRKTYEARWIFGGWISSYIQ